MSKAPIKENANKTIINKIINFNNTHFIDVYNVEFRRGRIGFSISMNKKNMVNFCQNVLNKKINNESQFKRALKKIVKKEINATYQGSTLKNIEFKNQTINAKDLKISNNLSSAIFYLAYIKTKSIPTKEMLKSIKKELPKAYEHYNLRSLEYAAEQEREM